MELCNRTLGVIGLGNIGAIVAERARGLGMKVIAYDPFVTAEAARASSASSCVDLDALLARADSHHRARAAHARTRGPARPRGVREDEAGVRS